MAEPPVSSRTTTATIQPTFEDQIRAYRRNQRRRHNFRQTARRLGRTISGNSGRYERTLEQELDPNISLRKSMRERARLVPAEVLYHSRPDDAQHKIYNHRSEEAIKCAEGDQIDRRFIQPQSIERLNQSGYSFIHIGVLQVRIQALHRQRQGTMALVVFRDTRWEGDQSIFATMEVDLTRGGQLCYAIPDTMMTVRDFAEHVQMSVLTHGYENWQAGEANLLITRGVVGRMTNTSNAGFAYSINDVTDYLSSNGVRCIAGKPYDTRAIQGNQWILKPPQPVPVPMEPTSVQTHNLLGGSISLRFTDYQAAGPSAPPKYNRDDETEDEDEQSIHTETVAICLQEAPAQQHIPGVGNRPANEVWGPLGEDNGRWQYWVRYDNSPEPFNLQEVMARDAQSRKECIKASEPLCRPNPPAIKKRKGCYCHAGDNFDIEAHYHCWFCDIVCSSKNLLKEHEQSWCPFQRQVQLFGNDSDDEFDFTEPVPQYHYSDEEEEPKLYTTQVFVEEVSQPCRYMTNIVFPALPQIIATGWDNSDEAQLEQSSYRMRKSLSQTEDCLSSVPDDCSSNTGLGNTGQSTVTPPCTDERYLMCLEEPDVDWLEEAQNPGFWYFSVQESLQYNTTSNSDNDQNNDSDSSNNPDGYTPSPLWDLDSEENFDLSKTLEKETWESEYALEYPRRKPKQKEIVAVGTEEVEFDYPQLRKLQSIVASGITGENSSVYSPPEDAAMTPPGYPPATSPSNDVPIFEGYKPGGSFRRKDGNQFWQLPSAQTTQGAMFIIPQNLGMFHDVFLRWESITKNTMSQLSFVSAQDKMNFIENLLGEKEMCITTHL